MSLARATLRGRPLDLPGAPPYDCSDLNPFSGKKFNFAADDPWVAGKPDASAERRYLGAAREGWRDHPEWMDFLDPRSPAWDLKLAERDLYLHWWGPWLAAPDLRALDVGCGVGRMTTALLDRGATVYGVDADHESLRRCAWRSAARPGRLDLHWSSAHVLPDVEVDVGIACEVLCYVPDAPGALAALAARVRPGGAILLSVEARYGWALSQDAPTGGIGQALSDDPVLDLPGDRWVRTYTREAVEALLTGAGLRVERLVATHFLTDGPLEGVAPASLSREELLAWEEKCRSHPVFGQLNRAWTAVALKPA